MYTTHPYWYRGGEHRIVLKLKRVVLDSGFSNTCGKQFLVLACQKPYILSKCAILIGLDVLKFRQTWATYYLNFNLSR